MRHQLIISLQVNFRRLSELYNRTTESAKTVRLELTFALVLIKTCAILDMHID